MVVGGDINALGEIGGAAGVGAIGKNPQGEYARKKIADELMEKAGTTAQGVPWETIRSWIAIPTTHHSFDFH
jgi:hypothetical protein